MCKGCDLPSWEELKVKRGQHVIIKLQGASSIEPLTARTKDQYSSLKRQKLATREVKSWSVEDIPDSATIS